MLSTGALSRRTQNQAFRDRRGEILFIHAYTLGRMVARTHRELADKHVARIATTYHVWCSEQAAGVHEVVAGICKSAAGGFE